MTAVRALNFSRDNAPLSPSETFENFNPMQPFFEEGYLSQRFRPQKHQGNTRAHQMVRSRRTTWLTADVGRV